MLGLLRAIVLILAVAVAAAAIAQTPAAPLREETLEVPSLTMTDDAFIQGSMENATPVTLTGRLRLPESGEWFPVVVLLHGSGGPGGAQMPHWADRLNEYGVAAFALDSHTGRGMIEVFSDQGRLGILSPIYDLYRAVEVLAEHPAVDPERIAVMGFSRGGVGALYSSLVRFRDMHGPETGVIAGHMPFYPPCNFEFADDTDVTGAPIRAFHGEADDWNPLEVCRDYVDRLAAVGHDATLAAYPGAQHAFDNPGGPAYFVNDEAQTSRNCLRREVDGRLVNAATNEPFSWKDTCVEYGPAQQYDGPGADAAQAAVKDFLTELFGLP